MSRTAQKYGGILLTCEVEHGKGQLSLQVAAYMDGPDGTIPIPCATCKLMHVAKDDDEGKRDLYKAAEAVGVFCDWINDHEFDPKLLFDLADGVEDAMASIEQHVMGRCLCAYKTQGTT